MGCAAFGNLASVIVGVLMGERVEKLAKKLGDHSPAHLQYLRFASMILTIFTAVLRLITQMQDCHRTDYPWFS
jgi:hypothetical protein